MELMETLPQTMWQIHIEQLEKNDKKLWQKRFRDINAEKLILMLLARELQNNSRRKIKNCDLNNHGTKTWVNFGNLYHTLDNPWSIYPLSEMNGPH